MRVRARGKDSSSRCSTFCFCSLAASFFSSGVSSSSAAPFFSSATTSSNELICSVRATWLGVGLGLGFGLGLGLGFDLLRKGHLLVVQLLVFLVGLTVDLDWRVGRRQLLARQLLARQLLAVLVCTGAAILLR